MEEETKWKKKIREILRRAERYANSRVGCVPHRNELWWWRRRWEMEYRWRLKDLVKLAGL